MDILPDLVMTHFVGEDYRYIAPYARDIHGGYAVVIILSDYMRIRGLKTKELP